MTLTRKIEIVRELHYSKVPVLDYTPTYLAMSCPRHLRKPQQLQERPKHFQACIHHLIARRAEPVHEGIPQVALQMKEVAFRKAALLLLELIEA